MTSGSGLSASFTDIGRKKARYKEGQETDRRKERKEGTKGDGRVEEGI
jgi:hypothetical protein